MPSHGCKNLYRYDFSICFELLRIACQKNERRVGKKKKSLVRWKEIYSPEITSHNFSPSTKIPRPSVKCTIFWYKLIRVHTLKSFSKYPNPEKQSNTQKTTTSTLLIFLKKKNLCYKVTERAQRKATVSSLNQTHKKYPLFNQHSNKETTLSSQFRDNHYQ